MIAVARAFLRDAPLVLLDEPAAHLDPFSAAALNDAIAALMTGRTVIHVTHSPPAGGPPARRLALHDGRLAEPGALGSPAAPAALAGAAGPRDPGEVTLARRAATGPAPA